MRKASVPRLFYKIAEQQNKRRQEGGIYRRHCIPFPDIVLLFESDHEKNRIITITPSCNIAATFFVMKGIKNPPYDFISYGGADILFVEIDYLVLVTALEYSINELQQSALLVVSDKLLFLAPESRKDILIELSPS